MATFKRGVVPFANGIPNSFRDRTLQEQQFYSAFKGSNITIMSAKKYQWFKIADSQNEFDFSSNNMFVTEARGKKITLIKYKDGFMACAYACPHAGGILSNGHIDALGNMVCPIHRYKFSLQNGRNTSGEGYYLTTYPVEVREDGIFAGIEQKGFLNF